AISTVSVIAAMTEDPLTRAADVQRYAFRAAVCPHDDPDAHRLEGEVAAGPRRPRLHVSRARPQKERGRAQPPAPGRQPVDAAVPARDLEEDRTARRDC